MPLRVEFLNGDWERARIALDAENINVMFQTVSSVEPYTATIHIHPEDEATAIATLSAAGVPWEKPTPYY